MKLVTRSQKVIYVSVNSPHMTIDQVRALSDEQLDQHVKRCQEERAHVKVMTSAD